MSIVEVINAESQISIVPESDDNTVVVMSDADITTAIESGEQGPPGLPGAPGAPSTVPGPPGEDGNTILYGASDPTAAIGFNGDFYINTATGFIFGPKANGAWPAGTSLVGPQGPAGAAGADGNTILYGASDPTAGVGVNGNFYINTTTHFLFGPKAGGAWPAGTSLVGPQGAQGPAGTPGSDATGGSIYNIVADNGGMEVWQRTGPASNMTVAPGAAPYTTDRWYLAPGAAQQCFVGPTPGIANGSYTAAMVRRNSGQTGTGILTFGYPLTTDEIAQLRGSRCALSFVAKAGANWSPASGTLICYFITGTAPPTKATNGYTAQTQVIQINAALTPIATVFSGVSAGVVPSNATQAEVLFQWTPVGTAGADDSFTIDDVQLEIGATVHPFSRIPFRDMLEKCQAFYWKTFPYTTAPAQNIGNAAAINTDYVYANGAGAVAPRSFPRRMRAVPTCITYAPDAANSNFSNGIVCTIAGATEYGLCPVAASGGTVAGAAYTIHVTADASI